VGLGPLARIRDRLADAGSFSETWPAELRSALEAWSAEGAECDGEPRGEIGRRLLLLADVWGCLCAEGDPTASGLPGFFAEALDRLAQALQSDDFGPAAAWIPRESAAGWGDYLSLLDPAAEPTASSPWDEAPAEPEPVEAEPAIDLAALLR